MIADNLDILMFLAMCGIILLGFPVLFTLAGVGVLFAGFGYLLGVFDPLLARAVAGRIFGTMTDQILLAIPLFVVMGVALERSRIAEELLDCLVWLFGRLPGGLAISVSAVGALLAASTGIVGATIITLGLMALPTMLRHGYDRRFAAGSICAAGTLGQIIPPSTMLIILGATMSAAYQQAQYAAGVFSIQTLSIGQVFAGALLPGLMLVTFYVIYQILTAWLRPHIAPVYDRGDTLSGEPVTMRRLFRALVAPLALIVAVLGSILGGIATPSEAAAVGAVGGLLLAALKSRRGPRWPLYAGLICAVALLVLRGQADLRLGRTVADTLARPEMWFALALTAAVAVALALGLWRIWRDGVLAQILDSSVKINAMIFSIIIAASIFALVFRGVGGGERLRVLMEVIPGDQLGALIFVMVLIFLLGFVLEFVEITIIVIPIVGPVLMQMGFDPIWLSILIAINLQTSFQTPPFGFSLFYLRGAAPPEVRTIDIYRGVLPFLAIQVLAIVVLFSFPALATWLPRMIFG
jgi:tripartite ATP-independent transporter DctM subunit